MDRRARVLAVLICATLAALVVWWVTRRASARDATASAAREPSSTERRGGGASDAPGRFVRRDTGWESVTVRGTVYEARTSQPVGGGEVVFRGARGEVTTRADAQGQYVIDVTPGAYRAFVRGKGFASVGPRPPERIPGPPTERDLASARDDGAPLVVIRGDQDGVDLSVDRVATVRGRVSNRNGAPVAHAIVRAQGDLRPVTGGDVVESQRDGSFELEVPGGSYVVDATHPDYAGVAQSPTIVVDAERASDAIDLTLVAGCVIRGRVVTANGGAAGDGSVDFRREGMPDFEPSAPVARDGTFRFTTLVEGEVSIRAWPWQSPPSAPQTFRCSDGARHEAVLRIEDADPDLDGTIRTADGHLAAGAFLDIIALTPGGMNQQERADDSGNFGVYALPAGEYLVMVLVEGQGSVRQRVTVPSHDVALTLSGTGSIVGTVTGIDDGALTLSMQCGSSDNVLEPRLVAVTDGRFQLDGVPACGFAVVAKTGGRTLTTHVEVRPGQQAQATLDFSPEEPTPTDIAPRNEPPPPIDRDFEPPSPNDAPDLAQAPPDDATDDDAP